MKFVFLVLLYVLSAFIGYGQIVEPLSINYTEMSMPELIKAGKISVNIHLVNSIKAYKPDEEYVCFSDIYYALKGRDRVDFMTAYLISDQEKESLISIKEKVFDLGYDTSGMIYLAKLRG